jgi:hypothetical protein
LVNVQFDGISVKVEEDLEVLSAVRVPYLVGMPYMNNKRLVVQNLLLHLGESVSGHPPVRGV